MKWLIPKITSAQRLSIVPDKRELIFDTDLNAAFIGDGATVGGIRLEDTNIQPAREFYGVIFKESEIDGYLERDDTLIFDSDFFYLQSDSSSKPIVSLGSASSGANLGGGEGVFAQQSGLELRFKSLVEGSNITISSNADEITISSTGGGGGAAASGFYGITVAETDTTPSLTGINKINFNSDTFYITQNDPNTDEAIVNFRADMGLLVSTPRSITIESPSDNEDITWFFTDRELEVQNVRGVLIGSSTPRVEFYIKHNPSRDAIGESVTGKKSLLTSTTAAQGFNVTSSGKTIPSGSWVWIETTQSKGIVNEMNLSVTFRVID